MQRKRLTITVVQIVENRRDDLVHVLLVPDIRLQIVRHRLPHDTCNKGEFRESVTARSRQLFNAHSSRSPTLSVPRNPLNPANRTVALDCAVLSLR